MTLEERVEYLEAAVEELLKMAPYASLGYSAPSLEDFHATTVAKVKEAKERGGLKA